MEMTNSDNAPALFLNVWCVALGLHRIPICGVGEDGRQKFEKFLREVGELDDEDDVIDVESK